MSGPIFTAGEEMAIDGHRIEVVQDVLPGATPTGREMKIDGRFPNKGEMMPPGLIAEARRRMVKHG